MRGRGTILALAACLALAGPAAAQHGAGTTAAAILRLAPTPRAFALGEAYAALASDEASLFYNPARLAGSSGAVGLAFQTLPAGVSTGSLAAATKVGPGGLGGGLQFLNYGEIEVVEPDPAIEDGPGIPTGQRVGGGEVAVTAGYGVTIASVIQLGAALKLLRFQLAETEATGTALDLGVGADLFGGRIALGAAVQNLGGKTGPGEPAPLPRTIRGGAAWILDGGVGRRVALSVEAIANDGTVKIGSGIEASMRTHYALELVGRVGYHDRNEGDAQAPLVFGAGVAIAPVRIDYAYRDLGMLGATHLIGISILRTP